MKNQQRKSQVLTFYIVMCAGKICRVEDDDILDLADKKLPGSLFDDYGGARNAVRRTQNFWRKQGCVGRAA